MKSEDIVSALEKLSDMGVLRLNRRTGKYYSVYCPFHNDGNERHPSCGVLLEDEVRNGVSYKAGFWHCFTCSAAYTFPEGITKIFESQKIANRDGLEWLRENVPGFEESDFDFLIPEDLMSGIVSKYQMDVMRMRENKEQRFVPESELSKYRYTVDYMYQRRLTDDVISRYDVGVDLNFVPEGRKRKVPCVTFPVRDQRGRCLFVCRRSIENKFFFMPSEIQKPVYGIYELDPSSRSVIVCESIFNALTCVVYGMPAVALLGTGTPYQVECLQRLGVDEFVLALDPDAAGRKATNRLRKRLMSCAIVSAMEGIPEGKDINDLEKGEFVKIYNERI